MGEAKRGFGRVPGGRARGQLTGSRTSRRWLRLLLLSFLLPSCVPSAREAAPLQRVDQPPWPVVTREHVDLWLHGFAMVQDDTARIPFFQRDYRQRMVAVKSRANVSTALDANRETLRAHMATRPGLINAQFLALYFGSWRDIQRASEIFIQAEGDPRRSGDAQIQTIIATFANVFPARADREWLRLFVTSLSEEHERFYGPYWTAQQSDRASVMARLDSIWAQRYLPAFQRFLNNSQLPQGTLIPSLTIGAEGRTVLNRPPGVMIVTPLPERPENAIEVLYVFAHEAIIPVVQTSVEDHVTPAQRREGVATQFIANGTVRGGALLLERVAPELVDGYVRFYLTAAGLASPTEGGEARAAFAGAFPLPDQMLSAINSQLDVVMQGI